MGIDKYLPTEQELQAGGLFINKKFGPDDLYIGKKYVSGNISHTGDVFHIKLIKDERLVVINVYNKDYLPEIKQISKAILEDGIHIECVCRYCEPFPIVLFDTREPIDKGKIKLGKRWGGFEINPDPRA